MRDIDQRLRKVLGGDDELLNQFGEQSMFEKLADSFRGHSRWLMMVVWIYALVFTGLLVLCVVLFFHADAVQHMLAWGGGAVICTIFVAMLKMWYYGEMNKNEILRAVKRLELRLALHQRDETRAETADRSGAEA